jgi:threonyl-tRNA synthetase
MNAKIRDAQKEKIPYMLIVGDRKWKINRCPYENEAERT